MHLDIPKIYSNFVEHKLNIDPTIVPVQQKLWRFKDEKETAIKEVGKLLQARFIREIAYPSWLLLWLKSQWKIDNVHGLHWFKQSLSKRLLPTPKN